MRTDPLPLFQRGRRETLVRTHFLTTVMRGIRRSASATIIIAPETGRVKKIANEPLEMIKDCLIDASANGPKTIARTAGAIG